MYLVRFFLRMWRAATEGSARRVRRTFRIGGQAPRVRWKKNKDGLKRTIQEAVEVAKQHGVQIPPEDVIFHEADPGDLAGSLKDLLSGRPF